MYIPEIVRLAGPHSRGLYCAQRDDLLFIRLGAASLARTVSRDASVAPKWLRRHPSLLIHSDLEFHTTHLNNTHF